ncbi:MAG: inositol 2-dehydrogenase [Pseudomonadota bacterium]
MSLAIGLIGAGRIGAVHAAAIAETPGCHLAAVADAREEAATRLGDAHAVPVHEGADILEDAAIDAILIASSTDTHADLIEAGAAAGKAILCEKPVDLDLARARACQQAVAGATQPIMVGFNRRFDPHFGALKAALDAGRIGAPELLTITSYDPAPPPPDYVAVSGGLFRDMAIHDFDIAAWIFGAAPRRVGAMGSVLVDPAIGAAGDIDTAVTTLEFEDGRLAVIKNSRRAAYGYDQRLELLGEKGLLRAENVIENQIILATADGVTGAKPEHFFLERYAAAYRAELRAFVAAVAGEIPVPATLSDGVAALAVAEAAGQALRSGQAVDL